MGGPRPRPSRPPDPSRELEELRARLAEADETLRAIRTGGVDAVVIAGEHGPLVFTLEGGEPTYRALIESMNEGALTLTAKATVLYANQCFARMIQMPLEQVQGGSLRRFLSVKDRAALRPLLGRGEHSNAKLQVVLNGSEGSRVPAQLSVRPLATTGPDRATFGVVVTDMTEARRNEGLLRALSHRLVQAQEVERGRVALALHDHITQLLCAILFRTQALADKLPARDGALKREAMKLREMVGTAAEAVERISRDLRPGVLDEMGLVAVLRTTTAEFARRVGVPVKLSCPRFSARLPADTELAIYRILQEALKNIEQHAHAHHVTVRLRPQGDFLAMVVHDDGIGFDPDQPSARQGEGGLGLISMRERASHAGGTLMVKSARRAGTVIEVRMPLRSRTAAAR